MKRLMSLFSLFFLLMACNSNQANPTPLVATAVTDTLTLPTVMAVTATPSATAELTAKLDEYLQRLRA